MFMCTITSQTTWLHFHGCVVWSTAASNLITFPLLISLPSLSPFDPLVAHTSISLISEGLSVLSNMPHRAFSQVFPMCVRTHFMWHFNCTPWVEMPQVWERSRWLGVVALYGCFQVLLYTTDWLIDDSASPLILFPLLLISFYIYPFLEFFFPFLPLQSGSRSHGNAVEVWILIL